MRIDGQDLEQVIKIFGTQLLIELGQRREPPGDDGADRRRDVYVAGVPPSAVVVPAAGPEVDNLAAMEKPR